MSSHRGTLVDTNVLIDVLTDNPQWAQWSAQQLTRAIATGEVVLSPVVYAELSAGFERIEELDRRLPAQLRREAIPWEAAFLSGRAFKRHRERGGTRTSPLPDFFIAAHATVTGRALLTRDSARHAEHFPQLRLICPETHSNGD